MKKPPDPLFFVFSSLAAKTLVNHFHCPSFWQHHTLSKSLISSLPSFETLNVHAGFKQEHFKWLPISFRLFQLSTFVGTLKLSTDEAIPINYLKLARSLNVKTQPKILLFKRSGYQFQVGPFVYLQSQHMIQSLIPCLHNTGYSLFSRFAGVSVLFDQDPRWVGSTPSGGTHLRIRFAQILDMTRLMAVLYSNYKRNTPSNEPGAPIPFSLFLLINYHILTSCCRYARIWHWNFSFMLVIQSSRRPIFIVTQPLRTLCLFIPIGTCLPKHHYTFKRLSYSSLELMSAPSPNSPLSFSTSSNGSTDIQDDVPSSDHPAQSGIPVVLDGSGHHPSSNTHSPHYSSYSDALKLGVGGQGNPQMPHAQPEPSAEIRANKPSGIFSIGQSSNGDINKDESFLPNLSPPSHPPEINTEQLSACCLLGKIWGEPVPLSAIIHRTRNDWKFTKGQIEYIEHGNEWILIRFANAEDRRLVFDQRPWFVNGLNFVIVNWVPFFDPYATTIARVDQWIRIPRLPWEFWEREALKDLLKSIGDIVRVDQNTLLRLKGKFARVCVNIDITQPLPGSLTIARGGVSLRVPIIYEGLHEVCPLCGGDSHQLDSCPNLPVQKKIEVLVERFDAQGVSQANRTTSSSPGNPPPITNNWVTVSPRKRVRSMPAPKQPQSSKLNPGFSANILPSSHVAENPPLHMQKPEPSQVPKSTPIGRDGIIMDNSVVMNATEEPHIHSNPLDALHAGMETEDNVDMYLNLHNIEDLEMSTDSAKRKRCEDGEEATSQAT